MARVLIGTMKEITDISSVISQFAIYGDFVSCKPVGNGHINNTYRSTFNQAGAAVRYTHQRINKQVFKNPAAVVENISAVTDFLRGTYAADGLDDISRRTLTLVPCKNGKLFYLDENGDYWRTYLFVENVKTFEILDSAELAVRLGKAVGDFQNRLSAYDGKKLNDTIPRFHDMRLRYAQLDEALANDVKKRAAGIASELAFLAENRERGMVLSDGLASGKLREGITHNDTKLNNILFDEKTGDALCVIDLDTVMPGTVLFDTGDLIRTATNTAAEDEKDVSKVSFNIGLFKSIIAGYMSEASAFLSPYEKSLLAESGRVITQIMAVRMITDYLNGDVYYHTDYPEHNLVRARTQIALIRSMDAQWDTVQAFVNGL
ncbi:aminoglycoside phosphotransferase [Treponema brennaborense DSM 12168]|uniref:Aminoglycoside phosphotransferase n=2 Tax=Treponema TaxID=157 RepID=F4LM91_TREBD|nr:aminoglycoside phosphotransferase [Treponema brennaborense DSM 12168]